jgi:hypothetical protein
MKEFVIWVTADAARKQEAASAGFSPLYGTTLSLQNQTFGTKNDEQ